MGELTVSGFPRTGTTYLRQILQSAFPSLLVLDGYHRIQALKDSGWKAVTLRNPCDAVSSWIVYSDSRPVVIADALDWYCQFIEQAMLSPERIFLFTFDEFICSPDKTMNQFGELIGLQSRTLDHKHIQSVMSQDFARSFPSANTEYKYKYSESIVNSDSYQRAFEMYEEALDI